MAAQQVIDGNSGQISTQMLAPWWTDESGVTAIEYGLMAALIAVACIGAFTLYATAMNNMFTTWSNAVVAAL